ncbi:hypothetical protein GBF38_021298 [Nibea albiflora]|uniref:Uncharacterized protein n=1 Tax=Nibea albiflora TaxID=240163 RepID=A0ACB7FFT0_NIBAL|nr:hypothetical protein GBF38_021298 [Nibea albiflora]
MEGERVLIESTFNRPNKMKEMLKSVVKTDSKRWKLGRRKHRRADSKKLLENNNETCDGFNGCDNPVAPNNFNTHVEQRLQTVEEEINYEALAEVLRVSPDVSEDGSSSMRAGSLIQSSVSQNFPEPPADLDQNLQQHLLKKEVGAWLEKILQTEKNQEDSDCEEAFVGFYVDTIQCIEAVPKEAQKISSKLSLDVRAVCFQELLTFLKRYSTEQAEVLGKKAKLDKPELIPFFKTLTTCGEIKHHVQTAEVVKGCPLEEIMETLKNLEDRTLTLLKQIVADMTERNLKTYFKTENKHFFLLIILIKTYFAKDFSQDVKKRVMTEVYKLICHIYLKHLIRSSTSKLTKRWSPNVGQTVTEDAKLLHNTISELAPGVQHCNLLLLTVEELLECHSTVAVQLTVAGMQDCPTWREDQDLLPALLKWKGLSGRKVKEVLNILPSQQPRPVSCFSWLFCCVSRGPTITSREEDASDC